MSDMTIEHPTIDPDIFRRVANRLSSGIIKDKHKQGYICNALYNVGLKEYKQRFIDFIEDCYRPEGIEEQISDGSGWFGTSADPDNQVWRKTLLLEAALNLEEQQPKE